MLWLAIGCAFVGFSEEFVTRGLLIVGGRGTLHEGWVWFVSQHAPPDGARVRKWASMVR